jgi:hypothetical protein
MESIAGVLGGVEVCERVGNGKGRSKYPGSTQNR